MTDAAYPAGSHPSVDELADFHEGLSTGDAASQVEQHVVGCDACTAEVAALDEVAAMLADLAVDSPAMPAEVADRLDEAIALASRERAAGVPSLDEKRSQRTASSATPSLATRSFKWLGAAAAVVVIGTAGIAGIKGVGVGSGSDDADSTSAADEAVAGAGSGGDVDNQADAPGGAETFSPGGAKSVAPQRVSPKTLPDYAQTFAAFSSARATPDMAYVLRPFNRCVVPPVEAHEAVSRVRWQGELASVVVNREAREATVYGCEEPPERLYSTTY